MRFKDRFIALLAAVLLAVAVASCDYTRESEAPVERYDPESEAEGQEIPPEE